MSYGEFRGIFASMVAGELYRDRRPYEWFDLRDAIFDMSADEREVAMGLYLSHVCKTMGQHTEETTFTFCIDPDYSDPKPGPRTWRHLGIEEAVQFYDDDRMKRLAERGPCVVRIPKPGMPCTYQINADSYAYVVLEHPKEKVVHIMPRGGVQLFFDVDWDSDTPLNEYMIATLLRSDRYETWTLREKRKTGMRGWARKGNSIDSIGHSGLHFGVATSKIDRHF